MCSSDLKMVEFGRAAVLDLDLSGLQRVQRGAFKCRPLRRFPESGFDLSVLAPARALIADVEQGLRTLAGEGLLSVEFLQDFALPDGQRSLSFRLTLGAADRTLTSEEVAATRTRIIEGMRSSGYDLKV